MSQDTTPTTWRGEGAVRYGEVERLAEERGLVFERQRWRLEQSQGWAWRVRAPLGAQAAVHHSEEVVALGELVKAPGGPWAAINGGFYEERAGRMAPMGVVWSGGAQRHPYKKRGGSGLFVVGEAGPQVIHRDAWREWEAKRPKHALQSIDRIIAGGQTLVTPREGARSAARSAVVVGREAIWLVVLAADGSITERADGALQLRDTSWQGVPLWAFAAYLSETTDARDALNLDGAVSTQLIVEAAGKTWRILGERGTINAITLAP
jgi:uncharacterized protein YigE (DUF2233 family)